MAELGNEITRREFFKLLCAGILVFGFGNLLGANKAFNKVLSNAANASTAPSILGRFDDSTHIPGVVAIHIAVLHNGQVLLFSYPDDGLVPPQTHLTLHTGDLYAASIGQFVLNRQDMEKLTSIIRLSLVSTNPTRLACSLWNYTNHSHVEIDPGRNLFCAGHSFSSNGNLFLAGGEFGLSDTIGDLIRLILPETSDEEIRVRTGEGATKDVHRYVPGQGFLRLNSMDPGRWYPSCVTLPDGRIMVISGTNGQNAALSGLQNNMQIFDPITGNRGPLIDLARVNGGGFQIFHWYPFLHVLPSGLVFVHSRMRTHLYDWRNDRWSINAVGPTRHPYSRTGLANGTSVLLPLLPRVVGGVVTYPAGGRILILGGGGGESPHMPSDIIGYQLVRGSNSPQPVYEGGSTIRGPSPTSITHATPATNTAEIVDFDAERPAWRFTRNHMNNRRVLPDAILLPDGKVFVVNGSSAGWSGGFYTNIEFNLEAGPVPGTWPRFVEGAVNPVKTAELFDPISETWQNVARMKRHRLYHGAAALLPDGTVLVGGHDGFMNREPYRRSQYTLEIYSPPYLFLGKRPIIEASPDRVTYGREYPIVTYNPDDIVSVAMIRQSSVTHGLNTDQRYVGLHITRRDHPSKIYVVAPPNANIAPPGYYMLFVLDRIGVPSIAKWIQLGT